MYVRAHRPHILGVDVADQDVLVDGEAAAGREIVVDVAVAREAYVDDGARRQEHDREQRAGCAPSTATPGDAHHGLAARQMVRVAGCHAPGVPVPLGCGMALVAAPAAPAPADARKVRHGIGAPSRGT